ncbi:MAG: sulfatase-like hydrolase/transferase [Gemmatimonadales bacterium]|nr:MAG: sulfatase-like hydrolase/transferase [Gemmatimonadales bacterium]
MTAGRPSRREFLRQSGALGMALGMGEWIAACTPEPGRPRPNVVLVFTDDQGYGDVGVYGARGFTTPHLDRLAAEGMRFTDFYASQAVCSASRASLLTGCYAERVGVLGALGPGAEHGLGEAETTIAEMLKEVGYATAMVGKWHLGHREPFLPLQHGFDEYFGLPYSNDMWPVDYDGRPATEGNKLQYPPLPLLEGNEAIETIDTLEDQATLTARYTERAVDFIDRNASGPFFLYLAHSMPHVPLGVSDRFRGRSEQGMYGDVIQEIDWSVGELLEALDRHGLSDDTLFIFTSDNGPWLNYGNHAGSTGPLREGKGTAFEGGPRVPAIMRWPGRIAPGSVCRRMASTLDVLPTVAAVTQAVLPRLEIDGVSILPLLEGNGTATPREVFYFYYGGELRAVREGRWKRVFEHRTRSYVDQEPGMDGYPGPYAFPVVSDALYDLEADIGETRDVASRYPEVVARLDALAAEARSALGDRLTGQVGTEVRQPGRRTFDRPEDVVHAGVGARVRLAAGPDPRYGSGGAAALTDGRLGSRAHDDPRWLGFSGIDLLATVDLGAPIVLARVGLDCLEAQGPWIFLPRWLEVSISPDGEGWTPVGTLETDARRRDERSVRMLEVAIPGLEARFVRVHARPQVLPEWHPGAGEGAWIFVDEIVIEEV